MNNKRKFLYGPDSSASMMLQWRRTLLLLVLFASITAGHLHAQDGKIISTAIYVIHDSDAAVLKKRYLFYDSLTSATSLQQITYLSDELKIKGYVVQPSTPSKYPAIIYCRGGNRDFGQLNAFELFYMRQMAAWGYVVIGSQNRGCCGSEGKDEFGGADIHDVLNLLPALTLIPNADTSRIGIYGWSRGGMMTYLALKFSNRFKAAVVGAGAANLYENITARKDSFEHYVYAQLIPDYYKNKDRELHKRSVVYWADSICKTTALLLMHGSADWRVSPEESFEVVHKLYAAKHPVKFVFYPGGDHGLREYRKDTDDETRRWFDEYLKNGKALPNMEKHGR